MNSLTIQRLLFQLSCRNNCSARFYRPASMTKCSIRQLCSSSSSSGLKIDFSQFEPDNFGDLAQKLQRQQLTKNSKPSTLKSERLPDDPDGYEQLEIKRGIKISLPGYERILEQIYKKRPLDLYRLLDTYRSMVYEDRYKPSRNIYTMIINACAKAGYTQKAFELYSEMKRYEYRPTRAMITALFNSCANLEHLEIAEPSLKNRDMFKMTKHLSSNPYLSICRSLQHITLPSSLQEEGIMHFLAHFPNITHLRCTPFEQLLDLLEHSITNGSSNKLIAEKALKVLSNLRALSIAHPMSRNMVDRLLLNCPQIEELSLELQKYMSLSTLATSAQRLVKLELHNSANQSISFADHVVPILEGCGQQMQVLSLINFDHIDLTKCAQYCPNLRSLSAQCFTTITYQRRLLRWMNVRNPFGNLKHLRLRPRPDYSLPLDVCVSMLQNCLNICHIELYCCLELTDDNIDQINQTNRFERLQTFILRHGHSVTDHALCRLVSCATSLNNLVFHDCGLVPPEIGRAHV